MTQQGDTRQVVRESNAGARATPRALTWISAVRDENFFARPYNFTKRVKLLDIAFGKR